MPQTVPAARLTSGRTAEEEFLALICADEQLLRSEFDAIIAAEWPEPTPTRRGGADDAERPHRRERAGAGRDPDRPGPTRARHPGIGGWARQRSPP